MSKYYDDCCKPVKDCCYDCKPCPKPEEKLELHCGRGVTTLLSRAEERSEVAFLELNTNYLCDPLVKIDFTSVIDTVTLVAAAEPLAVNINIRFKLIRENQTGQRVVLGEWIYRRDRNEMMAMNNIEVGEGQTFCFTYCDKIVCKDCYVYKVIAIADIGEEVARVSILNPEMNALVRYYY